MRKPRRRRVRLIARSVASPAMKPGTRITGSSVRGWCRVAYDVAQRRRRSSSDSTAYRPASRTTLPSRSTSSARGRWNPSGRRKEPRVGFSSRELVAVDLLTPSRLRAGNPGSPFIASLWLTFGMTVTASEELFAPVGREVELCYQTFGTPDGEPLLLVMGLGGPMTWWEPDLCRLLADRGFHVIRFDNRDSGRSSRGVGRVTRTTLLRAAAGRRVRAPYSLADMAEDAFGLLDHLGIESAHVCGVSMGGMIAQTMAIAHPKRVRSLTSIMSTTGKRTVGWQHPSLLPNFLGRRAGRDGYIEMSYRTWRIIGSPNYPTSEEQIRVRAAETYDRGVTASGTLAPDDGDPHPAEPLAEAARADDADAGRPRPRRQDGARLRRARHGRRHPRRGAAPHRRHGPRPPAGPVRDLRRRHPAYRLPRDADPAAAVSTQHRDRR